MDSIPSYFFKAFPDGKTLGVIHDFSNHLVDFETGAETSVPGPYDPVPSPDGKILTVPMDGTLYFYSITQLRKASQYQRSVRVEDGPRKEKTVAEVPQSCQRCHTLWPWDDVSTLEKITIGGNRKLVDEITRRVSLPESAHNRMPPAPRAPLTAEEVATLRSYFRR